MARLRPLKPERYLNATNIHRFLTNWDIIPCLVTLSFFAVVPAIPDPDARIPIATLLAIFAICLAAFASWKGWTSYTEPIVRQNIITQDTPIKAFRARLEQEIRTLFKSENEFSERKALKGIVAKLRSPRDWTLDDWTSFGKVYTKYKNDPGGFTGLKPTEIFSQKRKAESKKRISIPTAFFVGVLGAIVGLSLTNAIDVLIGELHETGQQIIFSNLFNSKLPTLLIFLSFFPIAIVYYHCAAVVLSNDTATLITEGEASKFFGNFSVMLLEGIIIYFMAKTIPDPSSFSLLISLLAAIDIAWVIIFLILDSRNKQKDIPAYAEWIQFDLILLFFSLYFSVYIDKSMSSWPYLGLFVVSLLTTICFYKLYWTKFWSKFGYAQ